MLERLARDKHSSLLQKSVNYGQKSFIRQPPGQRLVVLHDLSGEDEAELLQRGAAELGRNLLLELEKKLTGCRSWSPVPGNTKRGSIAVPLTSCLTGLD